MTELKESQKLMQEYSNACAVYGDMLIGYEMMVENHNDVKVSVDRQLTRCRNILVDIKKAEEKEKAEEKANDKSQDKARESNTPATDTDKNS